MRRHKETLDASDNLSNHHLKDRRIRSLGVLAALVATSFALVGCSGSDERSQDPIRLGVDSGKTYGFISGSSVAKKYLGLFGPEISTVKLSVCEDSATIPDPLKDMATREASLDEIEDCQKVPAIVSYEGVSSLQDITGVMVRFKEDGDGVITSQDIQGPLRYPDK